MSISSYSGCGTAIIITSEFSINSAISSQSFLLQYSSLQSTFAPLASSISFNFACGYLLRAVLENDQNDVSNTTLAIYKIKICSFHRELIQFLRYVLIF